MKHDEVVLCASSAYEKKYYLNDEFRGLPDAVKDELKIMCVMFTEEVGGILTILFDEDGEIVIRPEKNEDDILYDDIACGLLVRRMEKQNAQLWEQLEAFFHAFVLREE